MPVIAIASHNPVKIEAARQGFQSAFPEQAFTLIPVTADSGVSAQPFSDQETLAGAEERATQASLALPDADYWVGIEGGVEEHPCGMAAFAWVVARGAVRGAALTGRGRSAAFFLPEAVAALVRQGMELGAADDLVFGRSNSKQANGAIGLLTGDVIDRAGLYVPAVVMALIPFKNPELYPQETSAPEDGILISSDPARLDLEAIHGYLSQYSYWAKDIPRGRVARSLANSLCIGAYQNGQQVGLVRVITDRATYAYLTDVYVVEALRGRGIARRMLAAAQAHPDLQGLRRWGLITRDAHDLYLPFGFTPLANPERHLEIYNPESYPARDEA
ncbi:MAG TPA: inosine/xanthosine triphosphatase [Anaerolineales bacterium]|nr:inosine/xanthosine triphosphatase [Anaerolineales bacterium]